MEKLDKIEIGSDQPATHSIIWLHGLGASGQDFVSIIPALKLTQPTRFIFPHAPVRPITINGGMPMPGWFDLYGLDPEAPQDEDGIQATSETLEKLIENEVARGIPSKHIFLAGFSQGGAIALHTALHYADQLGGIIALSTFLPLHYQFGEKKSEANQNIPVFLAHGTMDELVKFEYGGVTKDLLTQQGYSVDWHTYPMGHEVCLEEVQDLSKWLKGHQ